MKKKTSTEYSGTRDRIKQLVYKSTLTMHEDDQLFLDDANSHMQEEQTELLVKVNRLTIPMRVASIGSGVFLLAFLALLIYQKLNEVQ